MKEVLSADCYCVGFALLPFAAAGMFKNASLGSVAGLVCALFPWKPLVQIDGDGKRPIRRCS